MKKFRSLTFILTTLLFIAGCGSSTSPGNDDIDNNGEQKLEPRNFTIGVSGLVPRNRPDPSDEDWEDLWQKLPDYGEWLGMHAGWNEGDLDEAGIPEIIQVAFTDH